MPVVQADCSSAFAIRSVAEADNLLAGRFIKQTQDTFKSGGQKAELLPLLERCTRELQNDDRYKKDIRYLRVWIQYVSQLPLHDPLPVLYMSARSIACHIIHADQRLICLAWQYRLTSCQSPGTYLSSSRYGCLPPLAAGRDCSVAKLDRHVSQHLLTSSESILG